MSQAPCVTFAQALALLDALPPHPLPVDGRTLAQVLVHVAQGIEYAWQGFPQPRPKWFQRTLGAAAFAHFSRRGRMSHDRMAPIPGAPELPMGLSLPEARQRLEAAVAAFQAWPGPWAPHFAYGELDRAGHERAHAMHLADHLRPFSLRT